MRSAFLIASFFIFLRGASVLRAEHEEDGRGRFPASFSVPCASMTMPAWQDFLERQAGLYPEVFWSTIETYLEKCAADIVPRGKLACLARLHRMAVTRGREYRESRDMGFEQTTSDYLRARPRDAISIPAELRGGLPADFVKKAKEDPKGAVSFRSSLNDTNRLVFRREDDRYIKFFLAVARSDDTEFTGSSQVLDVIAIEKSTKKIHFMEYTLFNKQYIVNEKPGESCVGCHASGLVEISPTPGSVSTKQFTEIDSINKGMRDLVKQGFDWDGTYLPEGNGPPMGASQGCTTCHGPGKQRAALNSTLSPTMLKHRMLGQLTMPPSKAAQDIHAHYRRVTELSDLARDGVRSASHGVASDVGKTLPKRAFEALHAGGKLTEKQKDTLTDSAKTLAETADTTHKSLLADYDKDMRAWLAETRCIPKR